MIKLMYKHTHTQINAFTTEMMELKKLKIIKILHKSAKMIFQKSVNYKTENMKLMISITIA